MAESCPGTIYAKMTLHTGDLGDLYIPKGEARNVLVRAVFFNRLCEIRDGSFE